MKKLLSILLFSLFSFSIQAEQAPLAPQWQLTTQSGDNISLSQFKGKPVILHFWATWCPYCKRLQPKLVELQQQFPNVQLVGISFNEDEGAMPQDVLTERGHKFITAINGDEIAEKYGVVGTPTTFFLDKDGRAVFKYTNSDINDPRLPLAMKAITE